jgi:uncharacterized membrane protein YraQ (UPF0718 family)
MYFIYFITLVSLLISFLKDTKKTKKAIKIGAKKLWKITPTFLSILIVISIVLSVIPNEIIVKYLGSSTSYFGVLIAAIFGSITIIPGPISYPLAGILVNQGVAYSVVAAFTSSLMLVGVLTFPVEKKYFGKQFAILRNLISFVIALLIAFVFSFIKIDLS